MKNSLAAKAAFNVIRSSHLENTARHTNKVIRLAKFLAESKAIVTPHNLVSVGRSSHPVDIIDAFHKDLGQTMKNLQGIHSLLSDVREDHSVARLDNPETNLSAIFEDNYDPETKSLRFGESLFPLTQLFDKDAVMETVLQESLGISTLDYAVLHKNRKKVFKLDPNTLVTDQEKMEYIGAAPRIEDYSKVVDRIRDNLIEGYSQYMASYPREDRRLISEFTQRAMVESVKLDSTYITANGGVEQISPPHKKVSEVVSAIREHLSTSNLVKAVEVDRAADPKAVLSTLVKLDAVNFATGHEQPFDNSLSFRMIKNYKATGLFLPAYNLVAVDFRKGAGGVSLIHEYTHSIDINNSEIRDSSAREATLQLLRSRLDILTLKENYGNKAGYYYDEEEVMARGGELGYILNQFDYQGEPMSEFTQKVIDHELAIDEAYDINMTHPIAHYLKHKDIYFDVESMSPTYALAVKDYYQTHFGVHGLEPKPVNEVNVSRVMASKFIRPEPEQTLEEKKESRRYTPQNGLNTWLGETAKRSIEINEREQILPQTKLMELMLQRPFHIARTSNTFSDELLASQVKATSTLCAAVRENLTAETGAQAFRTIYRNAAFLNEGNRVINHKRVAQLTHICEGGKIQLDEPTYRNDCEDKKNALDKAADELYTKILSESQKVDPINSPLKPELRKLQLESSRVAGDKKNGYHKEIAAAIENYNDCVPDRGTVWERLTDTALLYKHIRLHSAPMVDLAKTAIKTIPSEELVAQFTNKEDTHILVAMLSDESLRENVIGSDPKFDGAVLQQLANLGTLNKMVLNTDSYINHGGYDQDPVRLGGKLIPHRNPHVPAWSVTASDLLPPTLESIHILGAIANKVEVVSPETAPVVEEVVIQEANQAKPTIEEPVPAADAVSQKATEANPEKAPEEPAKEVTVEEKPAFENVLIDAIKNKTPEPKPEPEKPKAHLTKASQQAFAF